MASTTTARVAWRLQFTGLSETEWASIQAVFNAANGRFGTFTFLDPTDNLLSWSEDLSHPVWTIDPMIQISGTTEDPLGGDAASKLVNGGQAPQRCVQELAVPSDFAYAFSVSLRADAPCVINLLRSADGCESSEAINVTDRWTRAVSSGVLGGSQDRVRFGLELLAGVSVCVFGPQVEAQPCAGPYKSKAARQGVYVSSRFEQDELVQTADAVGQYSTTIQITSSY